MTYCVGLYLDEGLVMVADTRTNAGVDNISTFAKLHHFHRAGERLLVAMTAGNLAVSQAVINLVQNGLRNPATGDVETVWSVTTMFGAAALFGEAVREVHRVHGESMKAHDVPFDVSILLGGQLAGRTMRLFQVYAAGNFIEATADTPFLQIGEHKYGKPILDRAVGRDTPIADAVKLALISMDSTLRSNLSVGLPLDVLVHRKDRVDDFTLHRVQENDDYFAMLRERWSSALAEAHRRIPPPSWADERGAG